MIKKIIAGNWKMHNGIQDSGKFLEGFTPLAQSNSRVEWVLFPPAISLSYVSNKLKGTGISLGAQNCHFEAKGAFTGEISVPMIKEIGAKYCLVGHSERRTLFFENDQVCAKKVKTIAEADMTPMLCVGETKEQREASKTEEVVKTQLTEGLKLFKGQTLTVAYEPVWAIGTGVVATPDMVRQAHKMIRQMLFSILGEPFGASVPILYGGSVKPDNFLDLAAIPNVDGFLVGGASLDPKSFAQIGQVPV